MEISRSVVTMSTAGLFVLVAGIAARRRELRRGPAIERAIALGRVFVAAPLATFGGLHPAAANGLMQMVPAWMPWRLFWAYLVGFALIATALSLISGRLVRWAALLAGAMLLTMALRGGALPIAQLGGAGLARRFRPGGFMFGVALGFLPCGLLYTALLAAMATGTAFWGALGMLGFGLGTVPLLAAIGAAGHLLALRPLLKRALPYCLLVNASVVVVAALSAAHLI